MNAPGDAVDQQWSGWAGYVCRHPWVVLLCSGVLLLGSAAAVAGGGRLAGEFQPQGQALHASQLVQRELPQPGRSSFQLVFSSASLRAQDQAFRTSMLGAVEPLEHDHRIAPRADAI